MNDTGSFSGKGSTEQKIPSTKAVHDHHSLLSIIDKSLKHLTQISEANFVAQDLYIELLKEKKTMKFDQIKKIYFTLTQGKAKQILFERDKKQLVETDYQNHEGLVRLCWRSIEKLVKKITYYMINQNHLSVISKSVLKLIHLNQQFVRRFQKLKNSSMLFIVEIMEKLIQENSILQKKIYDILLNRGYVVSLDEFYKLNGYGAEHRDSYYAKKQQQLSNSQSDEDPPNKPQIIAKNQAQNSRKQAIRKKKGFRLDCRYSWREKIQLQEKEDKEKFPANKTNYQIRQSFQKFIGDFLQNQNLNDILINYKFEEENLQKESKKEPHVSEEGFIHKKIFQSKIQTVLNQLKSNNVKVNSKLLQIIDNSSNQAISTKVNYAEKKYAQRKNSERKDSGLVAQRKLRQSYMINDRKIVNENFFRQLLRRNTTIQQFVNQELLKDTQKIQQDLQNMVYQNAKVNPNMIEFAKKEHNQNVPVNLKRSKFSKPQGKDMLMFNNHVKITEQTPSAKSIDTNRNFRFLQTELNCKYRFESKKNIPQLRHVESYADKIRMAKQDWEIKNEKTILEAIQSSAIDSSNPMRLAEVLHLLNKKKELQNQSFSQQFKSDQEIQVEQILKKCQGRRLKTQIMQNLASELKIKNITSEALNSKTNRFQKSSELMERTKTQQSPRGFTKNTNKNNSKAFFQSLKQNTKLYEVFDRRLRRIIPK